jgi:hypothetical protein
MATTRDAKFHSVRLTANPGAKITPQIIHGALDRIFKLNGCLACGLLGVDIHIHGGDPEPLLPNVEGFTGVTR